MLKLCKINACSDGTLGLHLSRAPWDPYPWVSGVQEGSSAHTAGVRTGDTVLEVNGFDVLGKKISELATIIRTHWNSGGSHVQFLIWRTKSEQNTVNQQSLQKFATCLQNIAQLLECPICLEVVKPPGWQCCNGHVLCDSCRGRTTKCPICRVTMGPRGRCLLSDKLFTLLAETFPCDVKGPNNEMSCPDHKPTSRITASLPKDDKRRKQVISTKLLPKSPQNKECTVVRYKNYHCPTGKSCAEQGTGNAYEMYSQWDVLTHLQRVHQLSVTQYYSTYGERMQVELMNKSISCISVVLDRLQPNAFTATLPRPEIPVNTTLVMAGGGHDGGILSNRTIDSNKTSDVELFFIGQIPVTDGEGGDGNVASGNERCAIFIWYCGSDENVKKFQAVIECKRSGTKWKGAIHSLTKGWNTIQCQKEFLELNARSTLDIVIEQK